MILHHPKVDDYLAFGCGRCSRFNTPECSVQRWPQQLQNLRRIALDCGLTEALKWSHPVYTWNGKNILIIGAFKDYCHLNFIKGSLLADPEKILSLPGENSNAGRSFRVTDLNRLLELESTLRAYIFEAIEVEKAGLKVEAKPVTASSYPEELTHKMDESPAFKKAFEALTPGRQRGYLLHFSQAKQASTRLARIEKWMPQIMAGKGIND